MHPQEHIKMVKQDIKDSIKINWYSDYDIVAQVYTCAFFCINIYKFVKVYKIEEDTKLKKIFYSVKIPSKT